MPFGVERIKNRNSRPVVLIRENWREGKRVRKRTRGNLTGMPDHVVAGIDAVLKGGVAARRLGELLSVERSLPHGHVAAILGICRELKLRRILHRSPGRKRELALAAVAARTVDPGSRLACARNLSPDTASSSLGAALGLGPVTGNEMLDMLDFPAEHWKHPGTANPIESLFATVRHRTVRTKGCLLQRTAKTMVFTLARGRGETVEPAGGKLAVARRRPGRWVQGRSGRGRNRGRNDRSARRLTGSPSPIFIHSSPAAAPGAGTRSPAAGRAAPGEGGVGV